MLTTREKEVLKLMADGLSNDEISAKLCISYNTTKTYLQYIYQKLELNNRASSIMRVRAVLWYLKNKDKINE